MSRTPKNFVLIFYEVADPGFEYEIYPSKRIECSSPKHLQKGQNVRIIYGPARAHGQIVEIGGKKFLETNLERLKEEHQESLKAPAEIKCKPKKDYILKVWNSLESPKPPTAGKAIQPDPTSENLREDHTNLQKDFSNLCILRSDEDSYENVENSDMPSPSSETSSCGKENTQESTNMVSIGTRGTKIPQHVYDLVNWTNYKTATRKLLMAVFTREVLATHCLSGKLSPAFQNKEVKERLNPIAISDIVQTVVKKCQVMESMVRNVITSKCADENKLYKKRLRKNPQTQ